MSIRLFGLGQKIARIDVSIRLFLATRIGIADRKISDTLANNRIPIRCPVQQNYSLTTPHESERVGRSKTQLSDIKFRKHWVSGMGGTPDFITEGSANNNSKNQNRNVPTLCVDLVEQGAHAYKTQMASVKLHGTIH